MRKTEASQRHYIKGLAERIRRRQLERPGTTVYVYAPSVTGKELSILRQEFRDIERSAIVSYIRVRPWRRD